MRADPHRIEAIAARAFPPSEMETLGGWRLHAAEGVSRRLNACWSIAPPDRDPADAIAAVEAWYAARGRPTIFKCADGAVAPLDLPGRLARRGYASQAETLVMTGPAHGAPDAEVEIAAAPGEAFLQVFTATELSAASVRERTEALARIPSPAAFAVIRRATEAAAVGAVAIEARWAGVFAMRTDPACRRQGLARRTLGALLHAAAGHGARNAYLQVEADNAPAIGLYRTAGFEPAYAYRYWIRP